MKIVAVIATAMAALFVLDDGADISSAQIVETGRCGQDAYYMYFSDGTLELFGTGSTYNYDTYLAPWYDYRKDITKIVIGEDITGLGAWTFVKCKSVKELTIPITLNSVGSDMSSAFAGCINIQKINFTYGTNGCGYNYSTERGSNSWYQDTPWYQSRDALKEIDFSVRIQGIGTYAFRELNLTSVTLPDSITYLSKHCFYNCEKLTDVSLPVSLNSYGDENCPAFEGCMAVENIRITPGNGVPFDYKNMEGIYNARLAPWNLNSDVAKSIVISDGLEKIGRYMFWYTNIKNLTIPLSVAPYATFYSNVYYFKGPYESLENVTITKGTGFVYDYGDKDSSLYLPWNKAPNLKKLTIGEGVTDLGNYMFNSCKAETVVLPNSLVSLGKLTFVNCSMKSLTLPINLNAAWLDKDPPFQGVTSVEKINFTPGSGYGFIYAASKGSNCWYQLTPWYQSRSVLKEVTFEEGIKRIGSNAFRELNIRSIEIPDTVETLGNHSFYSCSSLYSLTIPVSIDSMYSVMYPAFEKCENVTHLRLTAGTHGGVGFDSDLYYPFWCTSESKLNLLIVDEGITQIGTNVFKNYRFIDSESKTMLPTAENLSGHRFTGSFGMLKIADRAFDGSDSYVESNSDIGSCGPNATYSYSDGTLVISGYGDMYEYPFAGTPWFRHTDDIRKIVIGDGITTLSKWAFIKCTGLTELTMPITLNSVRFDSYPAFLGCCSVEKITFTCGDGGYGRDYAAYKGRDCWYQLTPWYQSRDCLKEITFADGTTHIGSDAFRELNITSIAIPASVTSLGSHCFYNCKALTDLKISMSVNPYGNENYPAFQGCAAIENITFCRGTGSPFYYNDWTGSSKNSDKAPWNTYSVPKKIVILEDVLSFGKYVFSGCNIRELTIPINLNAVWWDDYAVFKDATAIEKITFTPGSGYGFSYASSHGSNCIYKYTPWYLSKNTLKEIVFEDGIKSIGTNAFRELDLSSLVIPDSVESLGDNSFYHWDRLTHLTIPITLDCVQSAQHPAFDQCNRIASLKLTAGTNGRGFDYTDYLPIWCSSGCYLSKISVDGGITYIGDNTFAEYTFYESETRLISAIAENLSGHTFTGISGVMMLSDHAFDNTDPSDGPNTAKHNASGSVAIGTAVVSTIIVTFAYAWVRKRL